MSEAQSAARRAFHASLTPEQRSARARHAAKSKQKKMTFHERRLHGIKMRQAKLKSRGIIPPITTV